MGAKYRLVDALSRIEATTSSAAATMMTRVLPVVFAGTMLACGVAGSAAADDVCAPDDILLASTPAEPQTPEGRRAFETQREQFRPPVHLALLGDSLTARWHDVSSIRNHGLILNLGVEGDGVQHLLWRVLHYPMSTVSPDMATLLIGTNNLGVGNNVCVIERSMKLLVAKLALVWPDTRFILFGIPRRGVDLKFREADRLAANRILRSIAAGYKNFSYRDLDAPLLCGSPTDCAYYNSDMLHFGDRSYKVLSDIVNSESGSYSRNQEK